MKTAKDPRHKRRQELVQELFESSFHKQPISSKGQEIVEHEATLDGFIHKAAPDFPVENINKIDLAILRLSIYELAITKTEPVNVIIDEAVELAKEFGSDTSASFVNGVLGYLTKHAIT